MQRPADLKDNPKGGPSHSNLNDSGIDLHNARCGVNDTDALMKTTWQVWSSGLGGTAENMACDEALLLNVLRLGMPALRFYGWREKAASFGYFQNYAQIESWTALRPLVRRPTGGGLVPHDADWTYSLVFPPGHWWYELTAVESYRMVHEWVGRAFQRLALATELSHAPQKEGVGQCFIGAEQFDLLSQGRKIAGAAQRRNKHGLLIQGSIQPLPPTIQRQAWEQAMLDTAPVREGGVGVAWNSFQPDEALLSEAEELARRKYSQDGYNQKR